MAPLSIVTWKWVPISGQSVFTAVHVNALRGMLDRHLHIAHRMFCVTDDPDGIDGDVTIVPLPTDYLHTPRCRRRMHQFDREFSAQFGPRVLSMDLDVVIVDDLTPIVNRHEPLVLWKIDYAQTFSGSFVLMDAGVLHGLWERFHAQPDRYPAIAWPGGIGSDQAMLNYYLRTQPAIPYWTSRDGFVTFFGDTYEKFEHLGVGPGRRELPDGARIVVLGSADIGALTDGRFAWAEEHWQPFAGAGMRRAS